MRIMFGFLLVFSLMGAQAMSQEKSSEVETVAHVDLNKYLGRWYEVASIPQRFQKQCVANSMAEYSFAEDNMIRVMNSCETAQGDRSLSEARAKVVDANTNSKLKVTFVKFFDWIFAFGGNYWILDLDENYTYAVVGDPTREYAWILSRTPLLKHDQMVQIEKNLKAQGYDTCKILTTIQAGGFAERKPLCEVVSKGY